ncbi:monoamine oxidase [Thermolongibacillus altinsuensis]|uniref:Monoamine oxidase n=1 Tax=Thermolongibacillus altinsuensis TaxID=575256 RepID=A0A4R1QC09_9BACL|nr:NAD(P)/FAD-dependent oxidoreductase [Thermolongibacillus altinsuensis]TCL47030.1 monoamine oxidase [Thermolongibacillus altinsuensis]GMB09511.1 monoamine oxidase [Thermolongibacillus altinsuensis]
MVNYKSNESYDVIVIGGGFSGLTAARELRFLGHKVLLLEARDRLGGRTWVDTRLNSKLEMGGTYVHWFQPHVWTEITRYGLEIVSGPKAEKVYWISNGKSHQSTISDYKNKLKSTVDRLMSESHKYLPLPYDPLHSPLIKEIDGVTAEEFMKDFGLTQEEYDILHGWVASDFCGAPAEGAVTQIFRWWVFSQGNWNNHSAMISTYRLKEGTKALIEAIAADAKAEIKLSTIVRSVEHNHEGVIVTDHNNFQYKAKTVIVTVPLTTLQNIKFNPALSLEKLASSMEGQTSKGVKVWARVKGKLEPFDALAPGNYPLNSVHLDRFVDGDSILVGFGPSAAMLDPNDREAVEKALQHWIPEIEVIESTGHDWVNDEFSRETWPMLKPNQLTTYFEEWNTPENRVYLAGTTYAKGWAGFIDGAIESGLTVSRRVHKHLTGENTCN